MNKLGEIKKSKICYIDFLSGGLYVLFICIAILYMFKSNNIVEKDITMYILMLPPLVVGTLIIHELIHILLFVIFGKGKAKIKVIRDKEIGAIIIYQYNEDVFYNKIQTIITMLAPLIIITLISLLLLIYFPHSLNIKANMILNILGSIIDYGIVVRLLLQTHKSVKINYSYKKEDGVILNYYK